MKNLDDIESMNEAQRQQREAEQRKWTFWRILSFGTPESVETTIQYEKHNELLLDQLGDFIMPIQQPLADLSTALTELHTDLNNCLKSAASRGRGKGAILFQRGYLKSLRKMAEKLRQYGRDVRAERQKQPQRA